ncbi:MAG TPA: site-2 protease family protein [Victivallales bacterium]|nr:site-2 protease family protein [Victivallales bacterium]
MFAQSLFSNPQFYFMWIFLVVFSVCAHEYFHAQVALWEGDSTAYDNGYLTLNPLKQMGIMSLIALLLIGISWGGVPVNPNRMRHKYSEAIVAFAGPFINFILFILFSFAASIAYVKTGDGTSLLVQFFFIGGVLNTVLFIFNLIPVPPLDGWSIISVIFPKIHSINSELRNGFVFAIFAIVFFSFGKIFLFGAFITNTTVNMFTGWLL